MGGAGIGREAGGGHRPLTCPPTLAAMEVWCRRRIPVEGNFGQTYDSLNQSIHDLEGDFSATIELKVGGRGGWAGGSKGVGGGHREDGGGHGRNGAGAGGQGEGQCQACRGQGPDSGPAR